MTKLLWDQAGSRRVNGGIDRGVLYLPDGSAVPWSGLTEIAEDTPDAATPIYFDGLQIASVPANEDYASTLKAYTYPDAFASFDGVASIKPGLSVGDQRPGTFGISYRTGVATDLDPDGYKIHVIYGLTAIPATRTYNSISDQNNPTDFSWRLTAVPQAVTGFKPTAHAIIDSTRANKYLLQALESILYGTDITAPSLPSLDWLTNYAINYHYIVITDHGDGTWTATGPDELVYYLPTDSTSFVIDGVNTVWATSSPYAADTFTITDT